MENQKESRLRLWLRLIRPVFLLGGILMFALGAGIAHYLGALINWEAYVLGQLSVTLIQLGAQLLNEYYDALEDSGNPNRTFFSGGSGALGEGFLPRQSALIGALTSFSLVAVLMVLMVSRGYLSPGAWVILTAAILLAVFYSTPPVRLEATGYGELAAAILVANLVPAFAFILQSTEIHRFLGMATMPLTFLNLAMLIAFSFPDYATDIKYEKRNLLVRMGWEWGMVIHNILILSGFLMLAISMVMGLPWRIIWPALFGLPTGIFQIYQMQRIAAGDKPRWSLLTFTAVVTFALTAYFMAFAFWTS